MEENDLQQLGFSEYEARVYTALLANPDSTGYEIAAAAKVPRAKVYEVLDGLERKGFVLASGDEKRRCYQALPAPMLISRHREQTEATLNRLGARLARLEAGQARELLRTVRGRETVLDLVRQLVDNAASRIHISGLPADLLLLEQPLRAARRRGVQAYILSYGEVDLPELDVVVHKVTGVQYLQVAALGRWLGLVADFDQAVLAQVRDEETEAIWSSHPGIMFAVFSWIAHDITMYRFEQHFSRRPEFARLAESEYKKLAPMWMLEQHEGPKAEQAALSREQMTAGLQQRIARYRGQRATIQLHLTGEGGDIWHLRLHARGGSVEQGEAPDPDLVVRMSAGDFASLHLGQLPLSAFLTQGRIWVSGSLDLAAKLQDIL